MRLLILTPEFESGGGISTFYRHLAPALVRSGAEVRVIEGSAFIAGEPNPRSMEGVEVQTLEFGRLNAWLERFSTLAAAPVLRRHLAASWAMWEQADSGAWADIVEAADWGLPFVPPAVEASRPLVVQSHGSIGQIAVHDPLAGEEVQGSLIRILESAVIARAQTAQTYSRTNAAFWSGETGRPVGMISPALQVTSESRVGEVSERGLVAGRIQRWKGPQVLCQALTLMGESAPGVDWLGRDTSLGRREVSTAASMANAWPDIWGRLIRPSPPTPPAELAARQARAKFNLIPSDWDVFNFTVAEAMASGRPVVVSTGAGASELVTDGETGLLFDAGDAGSLAAALERLLSASQARLSAIGQAAREVVKTELDPNRIAETRLTAYREAIADYAETPPRPIDGWIGEICRPGAEGSDPEAFLGQFPIRSLGRHLATRLGEKFVASAGRRRP